MLLDLLMNGLPLSYAGGPIAYWRNPAIARVFDASLYMMGIE